ncbi:hypothetical protein B0H16DRAFT_1733633 [Mycena metata]|uniref:F-box domain-containing protein n=1 Tax=Mycena metata TaxID=1033252 RepID=A0AAD7HY91_9AGAR|nr:hypothetical protein B0H16DRAFT_1733633 [Mycena metata]
MLAYTPLDVILLILRLLTIEDALSVFTTCRSLREADCRPYWVYANIDIDALPGSAGRPRLDYSTFDTSQLRARALRSVAVYRSWRLSSVKPYKIRTIDTDYRIRRVLPVPWSNLLVILMDDSVYLRDLDTGHDTAITLQSYENTLLLTVKLFWVDSIHANVLVVHLAGRANIGLRSQLQLFMLDIVVASGSATHLASVSVPYNVSGIDLRGDRLAVYSRYSLSPRTSTIHAFDVAFGSSVTVQDAGVVHFKTLVGAASFAILNSRNFIVTGPRGIIVHSLDGASSTSSGPLARPIWCYMFRHADTLNHPPLGPISSDSRGFVSISISSGEYLRSFTMTQRSPNKRSFAVSEQRLVDKLPVYLGIAVGHSVGVYRRPYTMPLFVTYSLGDHGLNTHPFDYGSSIGETPTVLTGSVDFRPSGLETVVPRTIQLDEEQGRIALVLRTHNVRVARVVVIDLV